MSETRLEVRCSAELRALVEEAARVAQVPLSDWCRGAMRYYVLAGSPPVPLFAGDDE